MNAVTKWLVLSVIVLGACQRQPTPAPAVQNAQESQRTPRAAHPSPPNNETQPGHVAMDKNRPRLEVRTIDGTDYSLAAQRGKWTLVNFWATWCSPCLKEMPELSALDAMHEEIGVVGLAFEDISPADMQAFLKQHPVTYPIAIMDIYQPPADFDAPVGLPMTYLIAPDGNMAKKFVGPVTARDIQSAIAQGMSHADDHLVQPKDKKA